jgi:imidazolonepropionase-like amidohydrolase
MKYILLALISVAASVFFREETVKGDLLLQNINVINVKTGKVHYEVDVIITKEKISKILKHKKNSKYEIMQRVDGTGKFLIPGLWDMHTHTYGNYKDFFPLQLANGVTGIREMFGKLEEVNRIKSEIKTGVIDGPMIFSSGPIIDGKPPTWGTSDVAETPEQGREFVRKQKAEGADFIKVYFNLQKDVYLAIADEAKKLNLPLVGHLPNRVPLDEAVRAGHKSFEHFYNILEYYGDQAGLDQIEQNRKGRFVGDQFYERLNYGYQTFNPNKSDEAIRLLLNKSAWICPTYTVHKGFMRDYDPSYTDDKRLAFMSPSTVKRWMANKKEPLTEQEIKNWNSDKLWYERVLVESNKFNKAGVKFLAGTDSPNFFVYPGFSLHEELEIFVNEVGFTPLGALQTATLNAVQFLGIEKEVGTVEENKLANLVILDNNPLKNISHTKSISGIVLSGKYKSKSQLKDIELK